MRPTFRAVPKIEDNPDLERWLQFLTDEIAAQFEDVRESVPVVRSVEVRVTSRGRGNEITVSHGLGVVPTRYAIVDTPEQNDDSEEPWTLKKTRKAIGTIDRAFFKSTAPKGKVFTVRLESR